MDGSLIQRSMTGGEVAPALYGRADQVKYQTGLRTMRNFFVQRHGGAANRPGSQFIVEVKDSTFFHKMKKFVFNADQTYILLLGQQTQRVIRQGVQLAVSALDEWTGATPYAVADLVSLGGVNFYCLLAHTNQMPPNPTYWYPLPGTTYELPTPYLSADLAELQNVQSGDVVSLNHGSYAPRELSRRGHTNWTLAAAVFQPGQVSPTAIGVARGGAGSKTFRYKVTAVARETFEESLPGLGGPLPITAITQANPCVVTVTNNQAINGDEVYLTGIVGMEELNGKAFIVAGATANTFQLSGIDSRTFGAYVSGGTAQQTAATTSTKGTAKVITAATQANPCQITAAGHGFSTSDSVAIDTIVGMVQLNGGVYVVTVLDANNFTLNGVNSTGYTAYASGGTAQAATPVTAADPTAAAPHVLTWTPATNAAKYLIYKEDNGSGTYGYLGAAVSTTFKDTNISPDTTQTPPQVRTPFNSDGNYPSTVGYYAQRRLHGHSNNQPENVWGSKAGKYTNFSISSPLQADDAITFTVVGRQVNAIRHLVDLGNLVILTDGGEWVAAGDGNGAFSATDGPGAKQYGYNGAATIPPIIIGSNLLYVQARGSLVRDFRNTITQQGTQGYLGDDLTVFATHLFQGVTIRAWDYAQNPNSTVWAVLSNGLLLSFTYLKEHEIAGWARHDTDGLYEDVCVVPEGTEDAVYVIVLRTINGQPRRYVERFTSRRVTDVTIDARFMDSFLSYDGRNVLPITLTLSGGVGWDHTEALTLDATDAVFLVTDVGNVIVLTLGTDTVRLTIEVVSDPTSALVRPDRVVPATLREVVVSDWSRAVDELSGLEHLEGKAVAILGDGDVLTNGIDEPFTIVTGGKVTIDRPCTIVHIGLPYVCDLETLDLEIVNGQTIADKKKRVDSVVLHVENSRGGFVGEDPDHLVEDRPIIEHYREVIALQTGKIEWSIPTSWNSSGKVFIRQKDPLPMTVLSITPHVELGG